MEDMATAMVRYDNGAVLQVEASFSLNIEKDTGTIELFGTKAGAKLDPELTHLQRNQRLYGQREAGRAHGPELQRPV